MRHAPAAVGAIDAKPTPTHRPRALAPQVVSVRWSDWARLRDAAAKQQHLWDALLAAPQAPGSFTSVEAALRAQSTVAPASAGGARRAAARWWRMILDGGGG